jgi:hypothetical protein
MTKLRLLLTGTISAATAIMFMANSLFLLALLFGVIAFGSFGVYLYRSERDRLIVVNAKKPQPTIPPTDVLQTSKEDSLLFVPPPLRER